MYKLLNVDDNSKQCYKRCACVVELSVKAKCLQNRAALKIHTD